jgi:uncharacterized surface protein with fasciclin (FAS1) repeats
MTRLLSLTALIALTGCATDDTTDDNMDMTTETSETVPTTGTETSETNTDPGSIIDVAASVGTFETLLAAVDAAGLTSTLDEGGPFTVLAPTDDAFAALPDGTIEALLDDTDTLTDILLYHVVDGTVPAADVQAFSLVPTLQGSDVKVTVDGDVFLNDAQVTAADVMANNGIIHVIDTVLIPPGSITDIAVADPNFSTLVTALTAADLATTLDGDGPFTVFAPTNAAFDALPAGTLDSLLEDIPALTDVLLFHVTDDKLVASDVISADLVAMLSGDSAPVTETNGQFFIDDSPISITDIPASNGVIHVIDAVMIP